VAWAKCIARTIRGWGEMWPSKSKQQFSDRFERDARAIAALNHPNICTLHDIGHYLVMEFIEGADYRGAQLGNGVEEIAV
jgi:serine/threonine protein kinase